MEGQAQCTGQGSRRQTVLLGIRPQDLLGVSPFQHRRRHWYPTPAAGADPGVMIGLQIQKPVTRWPGGGHIDHETVPGDHLQHGLPRLPARPTGVLDQHKPGAEAPAEPGSVQPDWRPSQPAPHRADPSSNRRAVGSHPCVPGSAQRGRRAARPERVVDTTPATGTVSEVRVIVRLLAVVLLGALATIVIGRYAPEGSFFNDAADTMLRALRITWMPSLAPGVSQ